jgi:hypothetical protein
MATSTRNSGCFASAEVICPFSAVGDRVMSAATATILSGSLRERDTDTLTLTSAVPYRLPAPAAGGERNARPASREVMWPSGAVRVRSAGRHHLPAGAVLCGLKGSWEVNAGGPAEIAT